MDFQLRSINSGLEKLEIQAPDLRALCRILHALTCMMPIGRAICCGLILKIMFKNLKKLYFFKNLL